MIEPLEKREKLETKDYYADGITYSLQTGQTIVIVPELSEVVDKVNEIIKYLNTLSSSLNSVIKEVNKVIGDTNE